MNRTVILRLQSSLAGLFLLLGLVSVAQARGLPDFTELAEKNSLAVVNIATEQNAKTKRVPRGFSMPETPELPEGNPLNEFLERFLGEGMERHPGGLDTRSLGSGFVISPDGYILTNYHVVADADEIQVRFSDRRFYEAKVIGADKGSDVALIKIDASDLPTVKIGKSKDLKVGEWVLAIGSPFGFDHTVTAGIVSAKGRSLPSESYVPFIQTDVAINPGNSGGPLFNLNGEVIGVNSQIYSQTGGFMGLSFAIPIELAINVADQLREHGRVSRGYLGVLIQDVNHDLADSFGMSQPYGALISKVMPESPADEAGLRVGDVILEFNNQRLLNSSQLPPLVGATRVEENADLRVLRNGRELDIPVRVGRLDDGEEQAKVIPAKLEPDQIEQLGLSVIDIDSKVREKLGLEEAGGAIIGKVSPGAARDSGLRRGDIVLMFDGEDVDSAKHLRQLIEAAEDKRTVAVLVRRGEDPMFMALKLRD